MKCRCIKCDAEYTPNLPAWEFAPDAEDRDLMICHPCLAALRREDIKFMMAVSRTVGAGTNDKEEILDRLRNLMVTEQAYAKLVPEMEDAP